MKLIGLTPSVIDNSGPFPLNLLLLSPRHIIGVLGTSADPTAGDTGAIVTVTTGEKLHVLNSARDVADMILEADPAGATQVAENGARVY